MQLGLGNGIGFPRPAIITGGGWSPLSLADIYEWWEISDTSTITQSGGTASAVAGRVALTLAQATPSDQPTTGGTIGTNAIHALGFGGSNVYMQVSDTLAQPFTLASICRSNDTSSLQVLMNFDGSTTGARFGIQTTNQWRLDLGAAANFSVTTDTAAHVILLEVNGASSRLYYDGTLIGTANGGATGVTAWRLGLRGNGFNGWNGPISDTVICDAILSAGDRASLTSYLADKAGITVA